jgi:hypothetical protein
VWDEKQRKKFNKLKKVYEKKRIKYTEKIQILKSSLQKTETREVTSRYNFVKTRWPSLVRVFDLQK